MDRAVEEDVLTAGEVGMEARAELEQRADAPTDLDTDEGRLDDPGDQAQERRLAGAVAADEPDRATGRDPERDFLERNDVGRTRAPGRDDRILEAARLARIDLEATGRVLRDDLAWTHAHASEGTARARRTRPASTSTKRGSAFGISIRAKPRPSSCAFSVAS